MLNIDSSFLPTESIGDYRAHLTEVTLEENSYAPLVTIDFGNTETYLADAEEEIILPENWESVRAIASNGQTFTPCSNPESPQVGEFVYNPYTNTIQVYGNYGRSLQIFGWDKTIKFFPPLLPPPHPQLFTNLPLTGTIQFNRQFEQQPSAQFGLEMTLPKSQIQSIFAPGTELDLYGLPLRINSISITELKRAEYPDSRVQVSVSLGSRWENYLDKPCFLRSDGKNVILNNLPFQDPDCVSATSTTLRVNRNLSTTVPRLLKKIGIAYSGPDLAIVPIPLGTARDATVNPLQLLSDRTLLANSFVRWSNCECVEVVPIDSTRVWNYQESDILGEVETSFEAIAKTSKKRLTSIPFLHPPLPDLTNFPSVVQAAPVPQLQNELPIALAFEYPNSELTGNFTETQYQINSEQTQGRSLPRYVRISSKREVRVDGDKNAHIPLAEVKSIQDMSLIFDIGGQTKTRSTTTTEDGAPVQVVDEIWGFACAAAQIYDNSRDRLNGDPNVYWVCLKNTTTTYNYDLATGYQLSTNTSGYNTVRFRQESAQNPETLSLEPDDPEYGLYQFIRIPVLGRSRNFLRLMPDFGGVGEADLIRVCNRDGTSSFKINPNYAPPYYVESELTESVAYASTPNPENEGLTTDSDTPFLPDLTVGEESDREFDIQITEAIKEQTLVGFFDGTPIYRDGAEISPQKATKYIKDFKAQGPQIASALEQISIEESTGELPVATRKPNLYTEQQPSPDTTQQPIPRQKYRYFLRTTRYLESDPIIGSENFSIDGVAITFQQALAAAACKAAIENWRNGFTETLQIGGNLEMKEGDRFNYWCNGEYRQRVVLGAQTTLNILGAVDVSTPFDYAQGEPLNTSGVPKITAITSLRLGRWMLPEIEYSQTPVIKVDTSLTFAVSQTLGSAIDWTTVRSRRNP